MQVRHPSQGHDKAGAMHMDMDMPPPPPATHASVRLAGQGRAAEGEHSWLGVYVD